MFLPHVDILCDLLLNRHTATWNLIVLYDKLLQLFYSVQNLSQLLESRPLPTLANTKKAIWRNLLFIKNEAISLVGMRSKELWLVQKNHRIAEVEKTRSENLRLQLTLEAIWFEFWMKGGLATVQICVFRGWWFSNQFDIVSERPYSCNKVGREL